MGRSIGVLATRYLWAGIVEDVKLGDVKVYPDPALPQVDLKTVPAGDIEASGTVQVDAGCRPGREGAMPEFAEIGSAGIAMARGGEDLLRLHIEEAEPHGAMSHDAFEVADTAAAAITFPGV